MDELISKINGLKSLLGKQNAFIQRTDGKVTQIEEIEVRWERLQDLKERFNNLEADSYESCCDEAQLTKVLNSLGSVEDVLYTVMSLFKKRMNELNAQTTHNTSLSQQDQPSAAKSDVRLPKLQLPNFSGKYQEWPTFCDLFTASIHNNISLSGAIKLQYLKGALIGEATSFLNHFMITDANYEEAWKELDSHFNKPRYIIDAHLKTLFEQPEITQANQDTLGCLLTTTRETIRALEALKLPVDKWDYLLIYVITNKLDPESRQLWIRENASTNELKFESLLSFIEKRRLELQDVSSKRINTAGNNSTRANVHSAVIQRSCVCCNANHLLMHCSQYKSLDPSSRRNLVNKKALCVNCLQGGHKLHQCKSSSCRTCGKRHHTTLHQAMTSIVQREASHANASSSTTFSVHATSSENISTILPTAIVHVLDNKNKVQVCRILLDSGSQISIITEACAQKLGLKRRPARVHIKSVSSTEAGSSKGIITIKMSSIFNPDMQITADTFILNKITDQVPDTLIDTHNWEFVNSIPLADRNFNRPGNIDILLGADVFFDILRQGKITCSDSTHIAQNTIFGWIIAGRCTAQTTQSSHLNMHISADLSKLLQRFWEVEDLNEYPIYTQEEQRCEKIFKETHQRRSDGRYVVDLPFNERIKQLGDSKRNAISRLISMERRFKQNNALRDQYIEFMREYQALGHMKPVCCSESQTSSYYIPHHFVTKESSTTTKFRVVFDASKKTSTGISLNDNTLKGPVIQQDLRDIVLRFRLGKIGITGDIIKMYRQVLINPKHTQYQRIVWRESDTDSIQEFELQTVTYGTTPAPFLATRSLYQLAEDERKEFPQASHILQRDFYVDDLMTGVNSVEEAMQVQQDIVTLLKRGGFSLRKYSSNSEKFLASLPPELLECAVPLSINPDDSVKILGLFWQPAQDCFSYSVQLQDPAIFTKRQLLSDTSKIYDPLGWITPSTTYAKCLFQQLWLHGLQWDHELPEATKQQWKSFREALPNLKKLKIPRWIPNNAKYIELHGFADASQAAYAAVVYARHKDDNHKWHINLVMAKSKVAPIKQISLPRLELCAALLLTRVLVQVSRACEIPVKCFCWTDSTVVLAWLSDHPCKWKSFIGNRTSEILSSYPAQHWHHVQSKHNPADCASRGILPTQLITHPLWWNGPAWLQQDDMPNSTQSSLDYENAIKEQRITCLHISPTIDTLDLPVRYSSLTKLQRITALCRRFITNCKIPPAERLNQNLTVNEHS